MRYQIEVTHVNASDPEAADYVTETVTIDAATERNAFDAIVRQFDAIGRGVTSQVVKGL